MEGSFRSSVLASMMDTYVVMKYHLACLVSHPANTLAILHKETLRMSPGVGTGISKPMLGS